jgi:hypothetical protein
MFNIQTRIRIDFNPSKRIRSRIQSENIHTVFIPTAKKRIYSFLGGATSLGFSSLLGSLPQLVWDKRLCCCCCCCLAVLLNSQLSPSIKFASLIKTRWLNCFNRCCVVADLQLDWDTLPAWGSSPAQVLPLHIHFEWILQTRSFWIHDIRNWVTLTHRGYIIKQKSWLQLDLCRFSRQISKLLTSLSYSKIRNQRLQDLMLR